MKEIRGLSENTIQSYRYHADGSNSPFRDHCSDLSPLVASPSFVFAFRTSIFALDYCQHQSTPNPGIRKGWLPDMEIQPIRP